MTQPAKSTAPRHLTSGETYDLDTFEPEVYFQPHRQAYPPLARLPSMGPLDGPSALQQPNVSTFKPPPFQFRP